MSERGLDLRRAVRVVRRHLVAVGAVAAFGLLMGAGYAALRPAMLSSSALVVVSSSARDVATQVLIADSNPVLTGALPAVRPAMSLSELRSRVRITGLTSNVISITAAGSTAGQAERTANAVARSYLRFVGDARRFDWRVQARLLQPAGNATGRSPPADMLVSGGLGGLFGALAGSIGAVAYRRGSRRLRERDEIGQAIGASVLASFPVAQPADASRWAMLLADYQPSTVHAWQLRGALRYLGQADFPTALADDRDGLSVTVLSLASDRKALATGPQLAAFAATLGIPTALVIGPQQAASAAAILRAACQAGPSRGPLRTVVTDQGEVARQPGARLTVSIAVVDTRQPQVAGTMRTDMTVLAVSAGAATAAQLAGVALSAAADGRQIDGILVADPEPDDRTTGRVPPLRPAQQRPPARPARLPVALLAAEAAVAAGSGELAGSAADPESAAREEPAPAPQPVASAPAAAQESAPKDEPVVGAPAAQEQPSPAADSAPSAHAAEDEPVPAAEPVPSRPPVHDQTSPAAEPAAAGEPVPQREPVASRPAALDGPSAGAEPVHRLPAARDEPAPAAEPVPSLPASDEPAAAPEPVPRRRTAAPRRVPVAGPAVAAVAGPRYFASWWRPGTVVAATMAILAFGVAAAAGVLPLPGHNVVTTHRAAHWRTPAGAQRRAAAWVASQVSRSAIMACDAAMCSALQARGVPAANLLELGSRPTPAVLGSDIMVATAAVRREFGSRLIRHYAPTVVARFGTGRAAVQIRVTAPDGRATYLRQLHADLLARQAAAAQLLHNANLTIGQPARRQFAGGRVDARLLILIAALAGSRHVLIESFGDSGPGVADAAPLRSADIAVPSGSGSASGSLSWLLGFLHAQQPPFRPASITVVRPAGGRRAVRVQFDDPSPLMLLAPGGGMPEATSP